MSKSRVIQALILIIVLAFSYLLFSGDDSTPTETPSGLSQ